MGNKEANRLGLWLIPLTAAPFIAASLAGIAGSQEFDPFEAPTAAPIQPPHRTSTSVRTTSVPTATATLRRPDLQRRPLQAPYRIENPWRPAEKFVEPSTQRQAAAPQRPKPLATYASHVVQAAWQETTPPTTTGEQLPAPLPNEPVEGEIVEGHPEGTRPEGEWPGGMEFDAGWDGGCCGCGDRACGCGDPGCGCGDACDGCGGAGWPCCDACGQCGGGIANYRKGRVQYGDIAFNGWIAQGVTINPDDPNDGFNGPLTFNDRANEYQLNQLYVALESTVDRCASAWDIGGRVDLLYGTDYFFVQAAGLETRRDGTPRWNSGDGPRGEGAALYGFAMPQLYAEVFAPMGDGLSLKVGHFYSILGYESVMYPHNFFYSHTYARQYGEPFTHTGMLADYRLGSNWTLLGGFTRGWDNWEDQNSELAFLGGIEWCHPDGRESLRFALHTGSEDELGENNRTVYSLVYYRLLDRKLAYVLEHNFGYEDNAATRNDEEVPAHWYGIAQYLVWHINCETEFGLRVEWFRDEDNARVLGIPLDGGEGGNYVASTVGLNIYPSICEGLVLRPELRWDWSDTEFEDLDVQGMFDDFTDDEQFTIALSASLSF